jgi:hypothetical protein
MTSWQRLVPPLLSGTSVKQQIAVSALPLESRNWRPPADSETLVCELGNVRHLHQAG